MTQEEKDLLLKDLCARLPYGVKVKTNNIHILRLGTHTRVGEYVTDIIEPCKPYLFPLSSMTEEQKKELHNIQGVLTVDFELEEYKMVHLFQSQNVIDWLNENHLDYRGLIPMRLAIDATGLNIY